MNKLTVDTTWLDQIEIVGGHPAVDFINTVRAYTGPTLRDYLKTAGHVIAWHQHMGLIDASRARSLARLPAARRDPLLANALALRATLYAVFTGCIEQQPDIAALVRLNHELEKLARWRTLEPGTDGYAWRCHVTAQHPHSLLAPVAFAAAELLQSNDLARLKVCPADDCGWLFIDRSRNGSRTWCNMKTCGNLAKQRRHRARQRKQHSSE